MSKRSYDQASHDRRDKVPIPRRSVPVTDRREKQRVLHACEPCRQRKTKCDGSRPICGHCQRLLIGCVYQDGKRELQKRKMKDMETKVAVYESLFQKIQSRLEPDELTSFQETLSVVTPGTESSTLSTLRHATPRDDESFKSEESDLESEGSMDDVLPEDINSLYINRPTGFMGRGSEVSWIRLLRGELGLDPNFPKPIHDMKHLGGNIGGIGAGDRFFCATYHLDDVDIGLSGSNGNIDAYALPPKDLADELVYGYFETVHPIVPLISKMSFMNDYESLYHIGDPYKVDRQILTTINLVLAIGHRFYETMGRFLDCNHLTFFMRARILGALDGGALFGIPTLQDVQQLGLAGFYLLASKHTNRSWNVVGLAIRIGHGLGLHILNKDPNLSPEVKELRIRVWYSMVYLEVTLCLVTGRPSGIHAQDSTGPIPQSSDVWGIHRFGDRDPDIYYATLMKLARITAFVQSELYTNRTPRIKKDNSQSKRQKLMKKLDHQLRAWKEKLPDILDFSKESEDQRYIRQRVDLCFRYNNALMLVHFPSLGLSSLALTDPFSRQGSESCVSAAREVLGLLISHCSNQNGKTASQLAWWCLHHYLVCAEAVVILKVVQLTTPPVNSPSSKSIPAPPTLSSTRANYARELLDHARRPLEWLGRVATTDLAAHRTYDQLTQLLDRATMWLSRWERGLDPDTSGQSNMDLPPLHLQPHPYPQPSPPDLQTLFYPPTRMMQSTNSGTTSGGSSLPSPYQTSQHPPPQLLQQAQQTRQEREKQLQQMHQEDRDVLEQRQREEISRFLALQQHQRTHMMHTQASQRGEEDRRWMQITMGPSPGSNIENTPGPGTDPGGAWSFGTAEQGEAGGCRK